MVGLQQISFGEDALRFSLPRTLYFSLLSFNECSVFLVLCLAFVFRLDFCSDLVIFLHQGVFRPLVYVGFHQKCFLKKVWMVLEKRKSFYANSVTNGSMFTLWLRLLHVMLDVVLIVCLVVFFVAWLVSNDWDRSISLWKNHALFLLYGSMLLWYSPLMLYFGWLGACLQHVWLLQSCHKPLWSFGFWLVIPLYASVVLLLCMIMAVIAFLVGRSQSFASLYFVLSMSSTRASNSQKPSYSNVSTIHCYVWWCVANSPCAWWMTSPLGTPRGRYDEYSS
jgi:hypothetical protein